MLGGAAVAWARCISNMDPVVQAAFVLVTLAGGAGILIYLIAARHPPASWGSPHRQSSGHRNYRA